MDVSCWDFPSLSCCQRALRCLLLWVALSHCTSRAKLKLIFEFDLSVFEPVAPARSALWPEGLAPWRAALGSDAPSPGSTEIIAFKCGECVVLAGAMLKLSIPWSISLSFPVLVTRVGVLNLAPAGHDHSQPRHDCFVPWLEGLPVSAKAHGLTRGCFEVHAL